MPPLQSVTLVQLASLFRMLSFCYAQFFGDPDHQSAQFSLITQCAGARRIW